MLAHCCWGPRTRRSGSSSGSPGASAMGARSSGSSMRSRRWSASGCSAWRWGTRPCSTPTSCGTIQRWRSWPAARGAATGLAPLAGKSTLNRLEHAPAGGLTRYHKIGHDAAAIERLFVELFLDAHRRAPAQVTLDLDATDDPLHGHQEGRFFHGYYDCWCYLPLYVFCGRHLLAARLRRSNIDASAGAVEEIERIVRQIRARWPRVKILLRADSGFARDGLMSWCERNRRRLCVRAGPQRPAGG